MNWKKGIWFLLSFWVTIFFFKIWMDFLVLFLNNPDPRNLLNMNRFDWIFLAVTTLLLVGTFILTLRLYKKL